MSKLGRGKFHTLSVAFLLGSVLLLSCQPSQPVVTPKPTEKATEKATEKPAVTAKPTEKTAETPVKGGTLRLWLQADPQTLDPHVTTAQHPDYNIFDTLIEPDKDLNVTKEGLFKDWTIAADGKGIVFKLREGVKFHDGTNFDAAAVKSNIDRMKDPATKSPYAFNYAVVDSMEVVDSLTIKFNLRQPDPLLLPRMTTHGGMMVSPAAVQKLGQDFGRKPVGTGPFEFVEWLPSDQVIVKRFEGYWGKDKAGNKLPYLDQAVFKVIPDSSTAFANLRTGQLDLEATHVSFPPEQLPILKSDPNLTFTARAAATIAGVDMNTKTSPFDNKALRQAVALALDREGIAGFQGEGATLHSSIFHPMNWGSDPKIGVFPARDLSKAKAKMAEAGYPNGGVKVKYIALNAAPSPKVAEVVKANLSEIGIDIEIQAVAQAVWLSQVSTVGAPYQIATGSTGIGLADPGHIFGLMFHSKGTRNYFGPYGNSQLDQILDKAGNIYDQRERAALYQEASKMIVDDAPFVPLYVLNVIGGMNKKVRNFVKYADSIDRLKEVWLAR